jgi:hypothetical protein
MEVTRVEFYKVFLFAFFQKRIVKKIIMQVSGTDIMISSVRLGAISGASDVKILKVSCIAPKEKTVNNTASIFQPFI